MSTDTFQAMIRRLSAFWEEHGCAIHQGYDLEVGAGTFNPVTFLRCLGPEPYSAAYIEPCRRPTDGRYGENPNRVQHYFQFQVLMKPSPLNFQELYLESLEAIGFDLRQHDVRFVHDDWESPTLGASGLGWEVWMDGMEVTQFTYFQNAGGLPLHPTSGELTYGLERLALYKLGIDNIFDLPWTDKLTYGDIYRRNEVEWSRYNFEEATAELWFKHFDDYEREATRLIERQLPIPAYDFVMKASHAFNLLDARGVISVTERAAYIRRIRDLAKAVAQAYVESRETQKHPLMKLAQAPAAPQALPTLSDAFVQGGTEDFVLEIGSEELPATFVPIGCTNLKADLGKLLDHLGLSYESIETTGTPRRLTAIVHKLASGKSATEEVRRGPAIDKAYDSFGQPTPAGTGFFRSLGLTPPPLLNLRNGQVPDVSVKKHSGAEYLFVTIRESGKSASKLLSHALGDLVLGLQFPKKMRWNALDIEYPRPIRWLLALHGATIVPFKVGPIVSGRKSAGHRQLSPGYFDVARASEYVETLRAHNVIVLQDERKKRIVDQIKQVEEQIKARTISIDAVLPQVLHLTEYPTVLAADFDARFLSVPREVLISEMVEHQKYFPVQRADGQLINKFLITVDTQPSPQIEQGNVRVLSARLSDGQFLYQQDLAHSFESFLDKLKHITFLRGAGSLYEKAQRLVKHVEVIHGLYPQAPLEKCKRAALLAKADLSTGMVFEFPDLQGVIGRYYANAHGEAPEVAKAITEHWMPTGEKAPLPDSAVGTIVALADKIDTLIACFATGQIPRSSSDPHGLRRQALGIIRILLQHKIRLDLPSLIERCTKAYSDEVIQDRAAVAAEVAAFISNRVRNAFLHYGLEKDETQAALAGGWTDICDAYLKVQALHEFRASHAFGAMMEVYKRARGQIADIEPQELRPAVLSESAEKELYQAVSKMDAPFHEACQRGEYKQAYDLLAHLQAPLAKLFDEVKILADDPGIRANRIALLQKVFALFSKLVDFEQIQAAPALTPA